MMNIVKSGTTYRIYGNEVSLMKELPVKTFKVNFSKFTGIFLTEVKDLEVKEEKVYGNFQKKIDKVLTAFSLFERNMGIILSGQKGGGKTLFARRLAERGLKEGYPFLIVDGPVPGLKDFISSIEQKVIVLFDEFEKNFVNGEDGNEQDELLSMFDGTDSGNKLFIITCNETNKISSYMFGRPGRFHYHFRVGNPTEEEIKEYLEDNLFNEEKDKIEKICLLARAESDISYDALRAIAFELNTGSSVEEIIEELNIDFNFYSRKRYECVVKYKDGTTVVERIGMNPFIEQSYSFNFTGANYDFYLEFNTNDLVANRNDDLSIDINNVILTDFDREKEEPSKFVDKNNIIKIIFRKEEEFKPNIGKFLA